MSSSVLERPTLVLNRNWQPVAVSTVARALIKVWNESARIVDPSSFQIYGWEDWASLRPADGDPVIRTQWLTLKVPEVITLTRYDRLPIKIVAFSRRNVFKRDGFMCQYCGCKPGSEELTIDHVMPRSRGGLSSWTNCVSWRASTATRARPIGLRNRLTCHCEEHLRVPALEPALRTSWSTNRKLVQVCQRSVLERRTGRGLIDITNLLRIGSIELHLPVVQAAMSGYSDWPMRAIARKLGAPYSICEVMIDSFVSSLKDRAKTRHHLLVTDNDHPVGAQLMGAEPDEFPPAAKKLVEAGFDVIDINFGCPAKKASGRCRGGFHLGQPDVAIQILQRVRDAVPSETPVTVKMRRGLDDTLQSRDNFFRIIESAFELGIAAVTVHARTVEQKYVGPSRWAFLKEVRHLFPNRTLLGSGDLFTAGDCVRMLTETEVDGVTAARGSIGNPWIFSQVAALLRGEHMPQPPSVYEQREVICEHFRLAERILPADQVSKQLRKFGIHYSEWHPAADAVRAAFIAVRNAADWQQVITLHYAAEQPGRYPGSSGVM